MKKIMTIDWLTEMFFEEVKKIFGENISMGEKRYDNCIYETKPIKEGETIVETIIETSWFGLKRQVTEKGYKFKDHILLFKFSICKNDRKERYAPTTYTISLNTGNKLTCANAESISEAMNKRIQEDRILDTIEFILLRDYNKETITFHESFRRERLRGENDGRTDHKEVKG